MFQDGAEVFMPSSHDAETSDAAKQKAAAVNANVTQTVDGNAPSDERELLTIVF